MAKQSRDKGKRGEREARDQVKDKWNCPDCIRTAQVSGKFSSDLMNGPPDMHIEVKRYKRIGAARFMEQAIEDCEDEVPVVLMREDEGPWLVMIQMDDSERFARDLIGHLDSQAG